MAEINSALASGKEVTAHTDPLTIAGYRGSGYVISDPVTGEGAYKISGGKNGGFLDADDLSSLWGFFNDWVAPFVKGPLGAVLSVIEAIKELWGCSSPAAALVVGGAAVAIDIYASFILFSWLASLITIAAPVILLGLAGLLVIFALAVLNELLAHLLRSAARGPVCNE
jgi:hypothetical protein